MQRRVAVRTAVTGHAEFETPSVFAGYMKIGRLSAWRRRLAQDGALLGTLTRLFLDTVQSFYVKRCRSWRRHSVCRQ